MSTSTSTASEPIVAVDLFCGGGGLSTALAEACEALNRPVELYAINHDTTAIETHTRNHPWATHLNAHIEALHPPDVVEPGTVDILIAAPECTHFSTARGGKPVNPQLRASPMHVLDWIGKLQPTAVLLENVPEFQDWGPVIDGKPSRDGSKFEAWKTQLEADRYSVQHTVLNAADYGDVTSRRRFFVMARRDYQPEFPDPTHSKHGDEPGTEPWRPAAEILDWSDLGDTIWTRSRPLANNTMQRIAEGIREHCDDRLEPYADLIAEFNPDDVEQMQEDIVPVADLATAVESRDSPFLVKGVTLADDESQGSSTMVMGQHSGAKAKAASESPLPTIATRGAIHYINVDPFILPRNGAYRGIHSNPTYKPEDRPLHTVTARNHDGHLVWPFLIEYPSDEEADHEVTRAESPTTVERYALCAPDLYPLGLDLRYRMLQPPELAAAQGFPDDYDFAGNKTETTKQIGNAVPVNLGKALVMQLLQPTTQPTVSQFSEPASASSVDVSDD